MSNDTCAFTTYIPDSLAQEMDGCGIHIHTIMQANNTITFKLNSLSKNPQIQTPKKFMQSPTVPYFQCVDVPRRA